LSKSAYDVVMMALVINSNLGPISRRF